MSHPAFDLSNPNKIYALLGTFIKNPYGFHTTSGEGYLLLADAIMKLEKINPTIAANLTDSFNSWDKYDKSRQKLMLTYLQYLALNAVTDDVRNMAKKGLANKPSSIDENIHLA
ncbi:MAG: aminopeptidase N C-terminal domain-containing protein, partial [Legionella longbeachae]|nr:aminopeptidase N C-terminal domain-containing protein [Legionella longbeachae]